jgi:hypothetical protein
MKRPSALGAGGDFAVYSHFAAAELLALVLAFVDAPQFNRCI